MADTSFRFGSETDDKLLSPNEGDCLEIEEEEYDALNDETFGTLDPSSLDDWEEEHKHFAELAESSRQSERLENSIDKLVLDDSSYLFPASKNSVWSYEAPQNGKILSSSILSNVEKASKLHDNSINNGSVCDDILRGFNTSNNKFNASTSGSDKQSFKKFCTVEELERGLLHNKNTAQPNISLPSSAPVPSAPPAYPPIYPRPKIPHPYVQPMPIFRHMVPPIEGGVPPPHIRPHVHYLPPRPNIPPGLVRLMPPSHYMQGGPAPPPGLIYPPPHQQFPVNHPFNFPAPPRLANVQNINQNNRPVHHNQHKNKMETNNARPRNEYYETYKDEYSNLMSNREKQWLINIQLMQLNTGTPYFDDYYYTIFKERKAKDSKENQSPLLTKNPWQNNKRNSDRHENQNTLTPKVYTPLQFENSLGKLQCGSVTAPRKIIDMDIVTPEKDNDNSLTASRDMKKTKQLLLELEAFYSMILKVEDLKNPMYKNNLEKLYEIKQKQRLRELDMATTAEQKQEILSCLRQESAPLTENSRDYLSKVINGLFQDEKYVNFLSIRKGKMLLLRILPYLTYALFSTQLCDLWIKVLLSIPTVGCKDSTGDNLLLRLHPYFKQYIQVSDMQVILSVVSNLLKTLSPESNRGTPISCLGKLPLNFITANKFGVSALAAIFIRAENLIASNATNEKQQTDWFDFVVCWAESLLVPKLVLATPIDEIPSKTFNKHCGRIKNLTVDSRKLLEKWMVNKS